MELIPVVPVDLPDNLRHWPSKLGIAAKLDPLILIGLDAGQFLFSCLILYHRNTCIEGEDIDRFCGVLHRTTHYSTHVHCPLACVVGDLGLDPDPTFVCRAYDDDPRVFAALLCLIYVSTSNLTSELHIISPLSIHSHRCGMLEETEVIPVGVTPEV